MDSAAAATAWGIIGAGLRPEDQLNRATKTLDCDHPLIAHELAHPAQPRTAIGVIVQALRDRNIPAVGAISLMAGRRGKRRRAIRAGRRALRIHELRLLNTSHLAIACLGSLAGYVTIDEAIRNPLLQRYMVELMDRETQPTLPDIPGIEPSAYKTDLVRRFANPAIRETVERVPGLSSLPMAEPIRG